MCRTPNTYVTADRKEKHKQSLDMTAGNYEKNKKLAKYILICQGRQLYLDSNSFLSICNKSLNGVRIYRSLKSRSHKTGAVVMKIVSK